MSPTKRILDQRLKQLQEIMQTNPSKDRTRNVLMNILEREIPEGISGIHVISNGGAGSSAFQFEEKVASKYPDSRLDSIENKLSKLAETDDRLDYLNAKYRNSFFQILYGNNGNFDQIRGLSLGLGYTLLWADGLSRFGKQHIGWMKAVKRVLRNQLRRVVRENGVLLCMTLAMSGQGPESPYHLLKRELNKYKRWKNDPSSTELADNVIQGVHAYFNSILASAKVHLKPLHAELYRGEDSRTHMVFMVWKVQLGQFKGQMFDPIINRIHEHILTTGYKYMIRPKAARKAKSKQIPKSYDHRAIKKLLEGKLKGYGIKFKKRKNLLSSNWTPDYTVEEFVNRCQNVYNREPTCIL